MAQSKYANLDKDALVAAVKARRSAGRTVKVDLRANEDTLRAALDSDDLENGDFDPNAKEEGKDVVPAKDTPTPTPAATPVEQEKTMPIVSAAVAALPAELRDQVVRMPEVSAQPTQPSDEEFAKGTLARNKADGLLYQVVKGKPDEFNKSVKARVPAQKSGHPGFFWEGSEEEFAALFEKR